MQFTSLFEDSRENSASQRLEMLRGADFPLEELLNSFSNELIRARRREAAFLSALVHLCLAIFLILNPKLFNGTQRAFKINAPADSLENQNLTYLEMPKDLITPKKPPVKPKVMSDQDRHFEQQDKILDSVSNPIKAAPKPASPPQELEEAKNQPPAPPAPPPDAPKDADSKPAEHNEQSGLQLQDVPKPIAHPQIPLLGVGNPLDQAIQQAAHDRSSRGLGISQTNPLPRPLNLPGGVSAPGQTGEGVQILTDTQGVDFSDYLQRVVDTVRRNWYAVMPEAVYLGRKGRVVIIFNIMANGSVPGMNPVSGSGTASLDQAAAASISASNPFPPLPSAFHGPFITLQFSFYYNLNPSDVP